MDQTPNGTPVNVNLSGIVNTSYIQNALSGVPFSKTAVPQGAQAALLQNNSSISQTVYLPYAGFQAYTLSFMLAFAGQGSETADPGLYSEPVEVEFDGNAIGQFSAQADRSVSFHQYNLNLNPLFGSQGYHTLTFRGGGLNSVATQFPDPGLLARIENNGEAFLDNVQLAPALPTGSAGFGFDLGSNYPTLDQAHVFQTYELGIPGWFTFGNAGTILNPPGGAWLPGTAPFGLNPPPDATEGDGLGFLAGNAVITQTITNDYPGQYFITMSAAQGNSALAENLSITLDGKPLDILPVTGTSFSLLPTGPFTLGPAIYPQSHVLTITGTGPSGAGVYLDNLQFHVLPPPGPTKLEVAAVSPTENDLSWTFDDLAPGETITGYKVERAVANGGIPASWQILSSTESGGVSPGVAGAIVFPGGGASFGGSFQDIWAQAGVTYVYRVIAETLLGNSEPSDEVEVTTIPSNLAGSGQDGGPITNGSVSNPGYYRIMLTFNPDVGDQTDSTFNATPALGQWSKLGSSQLAGVSASYQRGLRLGAFHEYRGGRRQNTFGPEDHPLTDRANQMLPFTGNGSQWISTIQIASDIDTSTGEGFDDVYVRVTVQKLEMTVSDAANPSNSVTLQGDGSSATPTLYLPANASGTAQIDLTVDAGSTPTDLLTWSYSGDPATPNTGVFSLQTADFFSTVQTFIVKPTETGIGHDVITVSSQSGVSQVVDVEIVLIEATAKTIKDNAVTGNLPASLKLTDGAYVPVDDGDYDYDLFADDSEPGGTPPIGDDRLLPLVLTGTGDSTPTDGYMLETLPTNVSVFESNGGDYTLVRPSALIQNQNDVTLYVEGVSVGSGTIKVDWKANGVLYTDVDGIKISTFEMSGPLNVPGYGTYEYKGTGALASSQWVTPLAGTGTIETGANTSDATIMWNSGPVQGEAAYMVNSNYQWDVDVNVVAVTVSTPTSAFKIGTVIATPPGQVVHHQNSQVEGIRIGAGSSTAGQTPGISWSANVVLAGPDGNRGVSQIQVGFIQDQDFYSAIGTYTDGSTLTSDVAQEIVEAGGAILDQSKTAAFGAWYDTSSTALFQNASSSNLSQTISSNDSPGDIIPLWNPQQTTANVNGSVPILNHTTLFYDFELRVVAATKDMATNADEVYLFASVPVEL